MNKMISYISERNLLSCFLNSCAVKFLWMNVPSKMPMHKPRNKPSLPSYTLVGNTRQLRAKNIK